MYTVSIEYCGGLGNQLFQLFTVMSYAFDTGRKVLLKYSDESPSITPRQTYWRSFLDAFKGFGDGSPNSVLIYENSSNEFQYANIQNPPSNVTLFGYFQSYKYFSHNFDRIYRDLNIDTKICSVKSEFENSYLSRQNAQTIVSVHFRLGDYKRLQQHHPLLPTTYYKNAIKLIHTKCMGDIKFLCFCEEEDMEYVEKMCTEIGLGNYQLVGRDVEGKDVEGRVEDWKQMLMMSLCDWNIIANSTFSWWGAMLKGPANDNVICPARWFHQQTSADLVLPMWVKM
jgi:hypothetical protein